MSFPPAVLNDTRTPITKSIERYARLLWRDGDVREVRMIDARGRIEAGYFDDAAALAHAAASSTAERIST